MMLFKTYKKGEEKVAVESNNAIRHWMNGRSSIPFEMLINIGTVLNHSMFVNSRLCRLWSDIIYKGFTQLCLSWCVNSIVLSITPKFKNITILFLRQNKSQVDDNAVITVANYCHSLMELNISNSLGISKLSIYALANCCPNLLKLCISGCSTIKEDTTLTHLVSSCTQLNWLNLKGCGNIVTDNSLKAIANHCKDMKYLSIEKCRMVGDDGLKSLGYGCSNLRVISLNGCVLITEVGVIALANSCRDLSLIELNNCPNITSGVIDELDRIYLKNEAEIDEEE